MSDEFTFDDDTKDVLTRGSIIKQGRPKKSKDNKKSRCINCYITEEEYDRFMTFLEGRPASMYLRSIILEKI